MTEAQLIHQGWDYWEAPTIWLGAQWSYEDKQRMSGRKPLKINRLEAFKRASGETIIGVTAARP